MREILLQLSGSQLVGYMTAGKMPDGKKIIQELHTIIFHTCLKAMISFLCLPVVARLPCFSFIVFLVGLDMVFRVSHNSILETRHGEIISYKVPRVFDEFQSVDRMR